MVRAKKRAADGEGKGSEVGYEGARMLEYIGVSLYLVRFIIL